MAPSNALDTSALSSHADRVFNVLKPALAPDH